MIFSKTSQLAVVIPNTPTSRETFAAQELVKYLEMIFSGIRISLTGENETPAGLKIIIGGPEHNSLTAGYISKAEFDRIVPGPEGIFIKAYGEDTLICAGSSKNVNERERGTIYAVYELLERYFGCSFAAYTNPDIAGGEYVPQLEKINLSGIEYIKATCDNIFRTANVEYHHRKVDQPLNRSFIDWLAKNRYNRIYNWMYAFDQAKEAGLIEEIERRGICIMAGYHDMLPYFLPQEGNAYFPEHYYETHPEYYKLMEDGTRFKITDHWGGWALCSRNPELPEVFANNILKWIELNPEVDTISILPLDGKRPQCCCEECSKYTKGENYVFFINTVARIIGKTHPEITIILTMYVDIWNYPEGLTLEPNICVCEAVWHHTGLRKIGKADGTSLIGTFYEKDLLEWGKTGAKLMFYDYYMGNQSARQRYIPAADEMQSIWTRFTQVGISGSSTQIEYYNFWNHIFNYYCFARTGYDIRFSMEDHLSRFTRIFGEGAPYIAEIIRIAEATLEGQVAIKFAGLYLMEHIDKDACYSFFDKALAAATTPFARNNIRMMRMQFRYSDVECIHTKHRGQEGQVYTVMENCYDPTGELYYMSRNFDSCYWNDPGYGIMLPMDNKKLADFVPDHWYQFEQ